MAVVAEFAFKYFYVVLDLLLVDAVAAFQIISRDLRCIWASRGGKASTSLLLLLL
jgi:hypothetical protein